MSSLAIEFIQFALEKNVLQFGEFTLKSGRQSPYFFNAGLFNQGEHLKQLGQFYARTIIEHDMKFDVLFGPAYKGIPLATATAIALSELNHNTHVSFNRKEAKDHGEKGMIIGAPLQGNVLMIDDVITAGTAFRQSKELVESEGAKLSGIIIALNRQEVGLNQSSAIEDIKQNDNIPVLSIASLDDIKAYLEAKGEQEKLEAIRAYQAQYGVKK